MGTRPFPVVYDVAAFELSEIIEPQLVANSLVHVLPRLRSRKLEPSNTVIAACACAHLIICVLNAKVGRAKSWHVRKGVDEYRLLQFLILRSIAQLSARKLSSLSVREFCEFVSTSLNTIRAGTLGRIGAFRQPYTRCHSSVYVVLNAYI